MSKQNYIFFSYAFDKEGKAHKLKNEETAQELKNDGLAWVHLDGNSKNSKKWLEREVSYLDHLIIDALFADETRPRIIEFETGMLIILRGIDLSNKNCDENLVSIRLWIDESRIISIQRINFSSAFNVAHNLEAGKKIRNPGEFLYNFMYETLNLISDAVDELDCKIDAIEEKVAKNAHDQKMRESVVAIRRRAMIFKRYMIPQKDVISKLRMSESEWINDWARRHFQENYDKICHVIEEIDEANDLSQIAHTEISNSIADKLNNSAFKISLIASIFMPLSFVAGLFGMNVGGIPFANDKDGFIIILGLMFAAIGSSLLFFKKKKLV